MGELILIALIIWAVSSKNKKKKSKAAAKKTLDFDRMIEQVKQSAAVVLDEASTPFSYPKKDNQRRDIAEGESTAVQLSMEDAFRGSMPDESTEGECVCDPELEHGITSTPPVDSVYSNEIGREPLVDLSARGLMRGVVMSEILQRPVQRMGKR